MFLVAAVPFTVLQLSFGAEKISLHSIFTTIHCFNIPFIIFLIQYIITFVVMIELRKIFNDIFACVTTKNVKGSFPRPSNCN